MRQLFLREGGFDGFFSKLAAQAEKAETVEEAKKVQAEGKAERFRVESAATAGTALAVELAQVVEVVKIQIVELAVWRQVQAVDLVAWVRAVEAALKIQAAG